MSPDTGVDARLLAVYRRLSRLAGCGWVACEQPECSWTRGVGGEERSTCPTPKTGVQWRVAAAVRGARLTTRVCLPACGDPCRTILASPPLSAFPTSYTPSPFGWCCPCSPLPRLTPSSFLILFSSRSRSSSLLRPARTESTRQLPCLRATLPLTRLLGQDQCGIVCIWVEPCRRWRGGGPSRSPTVDGGDKPQLCRAARHRATPRGALKRLRGLSTIAVAGRSERGRRLPWAVFRAPLDRRTPTTPLFSARDAEGTARARSTPTPGVATPLSHATPSPTPPPSSSDDWSLSLSATAELFSADFFTPPG